MINSLSAISRLKSFTASKPFGYLFVMCCKDKLAIFESSLNEHHAFYYEFCICISLAYGTSIPFLPAFDHATITQTFLRQIGNSAFGFSRTVLFCPLCTNKMFTLIQNDETKSLYSLHCIFLKNIDSMDFCTAVRKGREQKAPLRFTRLVFALQRTDRAH